MDKAEELRLLGQIMAQGQDLTHSIVPPIMGSMPSVPGYAPKQIGVDAAGRPRFDFRGSNVHHFTDEESAADIAKGGYRTVGNGYYGDAVSFTPDQNYGRQFGGVMTTGQVAKDAKILDSGNPRDANIIQSVLNGPYAPTTSSARPGQKTWSEKFRELGYHGLYDAGAGDLFMYDPSKVTPIK